jgi:hypothetical protein
VACSHQPNQWGDTTTNSTSSRNDSIAKLFDATVASRKAAKLDTFSETSKRKPNSMVLF